MITTNVVNTDQNVLNAQQSQYKFVVVFYRFSNKRHRQKRSNSSFRMEES